MDAAIYVNPNDGSLIAYADAEIAGFDPTSAAFDAYTCVNATVTGINGLQQDCEEDLSASVQVFEYPPTAGTYTIKAAGWYMLAADVAVNESSNNGYANGSVQVNNAVSCAPTISGVQVNYQPTNALVAGTSGSLLVYGTCMDSSTQVSIGPSGSQTGVALGSVTPELTVAALDYSVAPSAQPASWTLTLTTSAGSATTTIQVVPSLPYISGITPGIWPAGTSTPVTITGAGFGAVPATGCSVNSNLQVSSSGGVGFCITSWSDGLITGSATAPASDPGETVSVSVTGTGYGSGFFQSTSGSAGSNAATAQVTSADAPQFTVVSVNFPPTVAGSTNAYPLAVDLPSSTNGTTSLPAISSTVWNSSCQSPPCMNPSAFAQGTNISAVVSFSLSYPAAQPITNVRVEGAIAGLGKFVGTADPIQTGQFTATATVPADTSLPQGTRIYNPMTVSWSVAPFDYSNLACSQTPCQNAGSSSSTVYVTMAVPSGTYMALPANFPAQPILPLPLTVLGLAVGAGGATTAAAAFQNTWNHFSSGAGPANVTNWQGQDLYYYRSGLGFKCALYPLPLLTRSDGDGQCGSFALLLMWALAANGISSSWVPVGSIDTTLMLIRDWAATSQSNPSPPLYPWSLTLGTAALANSDLMQPPPNAATPTQYGDLTTQTTLPGQNTTPPSEKLFGSHFIVKLNNPSYAPLDSANAPNLQGPYFDPSYGRWYAGAADFESKAIWGYVQQLQNSNSWPTRKPGSIPGTGTCPSALLVPPQCINIAPFNP